jgi:signal transduction histidine kinase
MDNKNLAGKKQKKENDKIEVTRVIKNPVQIQKLSIDLIRSAKEDICITITSYQKEHLGVFQLLKEVASTRRNLAIKILVSTDKKLKEDFQLPTNVYVRHIDEAVYSNKMIILLLIDKAASLAIKLDKAHDDNIKNRSTNYDLNKAIDLAIYSTNKAIVLPYITMFETLWKDLETKEQTGTTTTTQLAEQLKNQGRIKNDFLNVAAHELRAPIQPILGLAEVLRSKKKPNTGEQEEILTIIIRNAKRLKVLTENILDLTRIERQVSLDLYKEVFDIRVVIYDSVSDIKSQLTDNQALSIDFNKYAVSGVLVEADRSRLVQVISNLLNNAIKFTKAGTILVSLETKVDRNDGNDEVIVRIKDSGTGIDAAILPRIFQKFMTQSDKGTGLGLFISKSIVEAHGGRIWGENNPDRKGATFSFSLPLLIRP